MCGAEKAPPTTGLSSSHLLTTKMNAFHGIEVVALDLGFIKTLRRDFGVFGDRQDRFDQLFDVGDVAPDKADYPQ